MFILGGKVKVGKNKLTKIVAKATMGLLLMSSVIPYNVLAESPSQSNLIGTNPSQTQTGTNQLTPEQLEALNKFTAESEMEISPQINVNSPNPIRVIVQFKQAPAEVAVIQQQVLGNELSLEDATKLADESHKQFNEFVQGMAQQTEGVNAITPFNNATLESEIQITNEYKNAFNGVSMILPGTDVEKLLESGLVSRIFEDRVIKLDPSKLEGSNLDYGTTINEGVTSTSITQLSDSEQNATTTTGTLKENSIPLPGIEDLHNEGIKGNGIKVGVIDTGIDYNHPDLTHVYKGYRKTDGVNPATIDPNTVKGWDFVDNDADPMETSYDDWIKAGSPIVEGHTYYTYHGTHVSGTIAGQAENEAVDADHRTLGVAPGVELYSYRVLGPYGSGYSSAIIGAIDKSVQDGMKVINLSLGSPMNDALAAESIAINNATIAGVTCVISAGNAGPGERTLGAPGTAALGISVGASDFPMAIPTQSAMVGNETFNNMKLLGRGFHDDLNTLVGTSYPIAYVGLGGINDFKDGNGQPLDLTGKVALIQRGTYALVDKIKNAKNAGAKAVILYNNVDGEIDAYLAQDTGLIPTFRLTKADGERLKAASTTSSITFGSVGSIVTEGNHLAGFSSRGPVTDNYDIKPDIVAPGVSVYSSYPEYIHSPEAGIDYSTAYARISGTSMAAPHIAGIAALILQEHADYTPAEVKEALQNTADKLSNDYSVYEVGAGLVDVKEAVHSNISIEVLNQTLHFDKNSGTNKMMDDKTGSILYNTVYKQTNVTTADRPVTIKNKGTQSKQFDISYEYSIAKTGVLNAAANGVTITTSTQSVTVEAGASSNLTATITVPGTAETGRYEGYVNIVNQTNPEEKYRLPFAVYVVEKGIGKTAMARPAISQVNWQPAHPFMSPPGLGYLKYRLNSPMKSVRLYIFDKDGRPLGSTGTRAETFSGATKVLNQDIFGTIDTIGGYYPFIGDPKDEKTDINLPRVKFTEDQYQVKLRAIDIDGTTTYETPMYPFIIDNKLPTLKFKDHAPGKVYELKDSDFTNETMNGNVYNGFWIHTNLYDEGAAQLASSGVTQSSNILWYYFNQKVLPDGDFPVEANGDAKFAIEKQDIENGPATVILFPMDAAGNAHLLNEFYPYAFIKEGSPYVVPTYDKDKVYKNDTLTMTLNLNNVEKLMSGTYEAGYYKDYLNFVDVKVNKKFQEYAATHGLTVTVDDPIVKPHPVLGVHKNTVKVGAHISGNEGFTGDIPFLDVTFKLVNDEFNVLWDTMDGEENMKSFSYTKQGESTPTEIPSFNQIDSYKIIPKHSYVTSYVRLQGVGQPLAGNGLSKFVTSAYAQGSDGKKYEGTVNDFNYIDIHGIPLSNDPYNIVFEAPGFLKSIQKVKLGTKTTWGEDIGEIKFIASSQPTAKAGDVNSDGVIDVLDAKQVFEKLGQQDNVNYQIEDFNKDGIVDNKDMQSVASNVYLSNPDATVKPKEVVKVDGVDMYATTYFNMAKVYSSVNTFKITSKNSKSATLNWLAVDPAGIWGGLKIQQQSSSDGITWPSNSSWADATLETPITVNSTSAVVKGLSDNTFYRFRLVVEGGLNGTLNGGNSNVVQMTTAFMKPTVNAIDDNDTTISGKADANVTIEVYNNNVMIATGKTDADGNYSINISPQKVGTVLTVCAIDDLTQKEVSITVQAQTTPVTPPVTPPVAPKAPSINVIDDNDTTITGSADANVNIVVKNNDVVLASGKANAEGHYRFEISTQKAGTVLTVSAKDAVGNQSQVTSITVLDRTAPKAPSINKIGDNDTTISGTAEANATIVVKNKDAIVATGKANTEGNYSITISKQKAGTVLTVNATDAAGNQSEATSITVVDVTAPKAPKVNVMDDNDTKISGSTEAGATIVVTNNDVEIATGTADSKGLFTIKMKQQKAGTVVTVKAIDKSGNESAATKIKVLDKTAPKTPVISNVIVKNKNEIQIMGKAEANSTIIVKNGNKIVATVKVSSKGTFTVKLTKVGKGKNNLTLYAVDYAGNKSSEVKRSVTVK
jgi:subtilisin family serine protease